MGSQRLYKWRDNNPAVVFLDIGYVNETAVASAQSKLTTINSAIEARGVLGLSLRRIFDAHGVSPSGSCYPPGLGPMSSFSFSPSPPLSIPYDPPPLHVARDWGRWT